MSSAFVKEEDEQWLHEVAPTMQALVNYLTRQNNGIRVYLLKNFIDAKSGIELQHMSNGMEYYKNADGRWELKL